MGKNKVTYDFDHPILVKDRKYRRYAREHIAISEIVSDVIEWEVKEDQTALKIPTKFHVHYNIKSIIGIDDSEAPIFGNRHTLEVSFPPRYPLVPCIIRMITPVWHPNIKSDGNYVGRICGNVKNFGKAYDLYQLVLRIGGILQYKNYHAEHVPPYPEDAKVAKWIMNYAEPKGIINKSENIVIDDTPLLSKYTHEPNIESSSSNIDKVQDIKSESPIKPEISKNPDPDPPKPKITITNLKEQTFKRSKLVFKIKDKNKDSELT